MRRDGTRVTCEASVCIPCCAAAPGHTELRRTNHVTKTRNHLRRRALPGLCQMHSSPTAPVQAVTPCHGNSPSYLLPSKAWSCARTHTQTMHTRHAHKTRTMGLSCFASWCSVPKRHLVHVGPPTPAQGAAGSDAPASAPGSAGSASGWSAVPTTTLASSSDPTTDPDPSSGRVPSDTWGTD